MTPEARSVPRPRGEVAWAAVLVVFIASFPFLAVPAASSEDSYLLPRVALLALFGLVGLLVPGGARDHRRFRWLALLLLVHAGLVLVSGVTHPDEDGWVFVLLGADRRVDGLLYQAALVLAGIAAARLFVTSTIARTWGLRALLAVGVLQAIQLVGQRLGVDPYATALYGRPFPSVAGSFGHPGVAAGFLLPLAVIAAVLTARSQPGRLRLVLGATAVACAVGVGVTENRTAWLALLGVLALWTLAERRVAALATALAVGAGAVVGSSALPVRAGHEQSVVETRTLETRLGMWRLALDTVGSIPGQPLIGGGPDAFRLALLRRGEVAPLLPIYRLEYGWPVDWELRDPRLVHLEGQPIRSTLVSGLLVRPDDTVVPVFYKVNIDKAHNLFLDRWLAYGLLDALLWVALAVAPLLWQFRFGTTCGRAYAWAVVALGVYYLTWFPFPQLEPLHLLLIALCWLEPSVVGPARSGRPGGVSARGLHLEETRVPVS